MDKKLRLFIYTGAIAGLIYPALALNNSISDKGINAIRLHQSPYNLLGRKIGIGQVEVGRPKKFALDKLLSRSTPCCRSQCGRSCQYGCRSHDCPR